MGRWLTADIRVTDSSLSAGAVARAHAPQSQTARVMLDSQGCVVFASSAIEDLLGFHYDTVVGEHISSLLPSLLACPDYAESFGRKWLRGKKVVNFATHARHADGRNVLVSVEVQKIGCYGLIPFLLLTPVK